MTRTDWTGWHEAYERPDSSLSGRLAAVRAQIGRRLDETAPAPVRVTSLCAGDGRDVLGVLAARADAARVAALLTERDAHLVERARDAARALAARVEVVCADAAASDLYAGTAPADLVLLCGIFGNIGDDDVRSLVRTAPQLCAPGAEVVWTRHRSEPDLTPAVRWWFTEAGFEEVAFVTPGADAWAVGVHRLVRAPDPLRRGEHWFTFVR